MIKNVVLLMLLFTLAMSCTNKKEMNINLDQNLNDPEHIGNIKIKKQKSEILKRILNFDQFFRENLYLIHYNFKKKLWWIGWESDFDDAYRIAYLNDSLLPKILNCKYITQRLKEKAMKNSKFDDPGNAGYVLTESEYGKNIFRISIQENEYSNFHNRCYLNNNSNDDVDAPLPREIGEKEALFYLMSFIHIIDENHAVYKINVKTTNMSERSQRGFLILELTKETGEWLIDDMYYIEKEDLIPVDDGFYELIDYESNKEAFETGLSN